MYRLYLSLVVVALFCPGPTYAGSSERGYALCEIEVTPMFSKFDPDFSLEPVVDIDKNERTFFFNGFVHANGSVTALAVACTTDLSGRRIEKIERLEGEVTLPPPPSKHVAYLRTDERSTPCNG